MRDRNGKGHGRVDAEGDEYGGQRGLCRSDSSWHGDEAREQCGGAVDEDEFGQIQVDAVGEADGAERDGVEELSGDVAAEQLQQLVTVTENAP